MTASVVIQTVITESVPQFRSKVQNDEKGRHRGLTSVPGLGEREKAEKCVGRIDDWRRVLDTVAATVEGRTRAT